MRPTCLWSRSTHCRATATTTSLGFTWVNERGEPNPYQANGMTLLPMADAIPYVEAFRCYRAYRRDRFGGGLPPEMRGLSAEELQPIRDYIAVMKAEETCRVGPVPLTRGLESGRMALTTFRHILMCRGIIRRTVG